MDADFTRLGLQTGFQMETRTDLTRWSFCDGLGVEALTTHL
jgi:hypothetical protein